MDDKEIITLYFARDDAAIRETALKYGNYCKTIAKNILGNPEDAEECVNDAFFRAWNSIPPHRPEMLSSYLGKITRNLSLDRVRQKQADKRGGGQAKLLFAELSECSMGAGSAKKYPGAGSLKKSPATGSMEECLKVANVEETLERRELANAINDFLNTLSEKKCNLFLCRYWYAYPVSEIAKSFKMTEGNVSVTLNRIRKKLKRYLTERGYQL